ncbi:hypothetical protein NUW58_g4858 [Xylaria curta]|uniref:Uncharacterized protein n=2 Tax=Xylaria curta TaxID=42375 RepID=A0ACC1NWZ3_9PEZI|nr:hypothetical protein NUW58_g6359 [Xylaria curta]KAJ2986801.1 hypothetical protein NUW58_g4858 [Xylaria curta]
MGFYNVSIFSLAFSLVVATAAATTSTATSTATIAASALPSLVSSLDDCAADCLPLVGTEVGCAPTDVECICSDVDAFRAHLGTCMKSKKCFSTDEIDLASDICTAVSKGPDAKIFASASSVIAHKVPEATKNAAVHMEFSAGIIAAAAMGAIAF